MIYQYPFRGLYKVSLPFGAPGKLWRCGYHSGLDLVSGAAGGDGVVYPVAPGKVIRRVVGNASYGNYVTVQHDDRMLSLYAHLDHISVTLGQQVGYDTVLGFEGATGNVTGKHLHLELHEGAYHYPATIDPAAFIEARRGERKEMEMTQGQFDTMMDNWLARQAEKAPGTWSKDDRVWAEQNGIILGNARGKMMYGAFCTREQMVAFLHRLSQLQS